MNYLPVFQCGHPRIPENWMTWGSTNDRFGKRQAYRCRTCHELKKQGKPTPGKVVFHCGHPRSKENMLSSGKSWRCKTCTYRRAGLKSYRVPLAVPNAVALGAEYLHGEAPKVKKVKRAPKIPIRKRTRITLENVWRTAFVQKTVDTESHSM